MTRLLPLAMGVLFPLNNHQLESVSAYAVGEFIVMSAPNPMALPATALIAIARLTFAGIGDLRVLRCLFISEVLCVDVVWLSFVMQCDTQRRHCRLRSLHSHLLLTSSRS